MAKAGKKLEVLVLNPIAQVGLKRLPAERYEVGQGIEVARRDPGALGGHARDGNSTPGSRRSGAPAPAPTTFRCKELSQARRAGVQRAGRQRQRGEGTGARRHADRGAQSRRLPGVRHGSGCERSRIWRRRSKAGKKAYAGVELPGHTLGVIGLGKIGSLVADAAIRLGMNVLGYDPEITVDAAWSLPSQVQQGATRWTSCCKASDFVTLHVPLVEKTRNLVNAKNLEQMKTGAVLLNFSRDGVVDDDGGAEGAGGEAAALLRHRFPVGGADRQARRDRAAAPGRLHPRGRGQLRGDGRRPGARLPASTAPWRTRSISRTRRCRANRRTASPSPTPTCRTCWRSISNAMGSRKINIHNMLNKSKGDMAYTLVDVDSPVPEAAIEELCAIKGVLAVRYLPVEAMSEKEISKLRAARSTRVDAELLALLNRRARAGAQGRRAEGRQARLPPRARERRSCARVARSATPAARCRPAARPRVFREIISACRALEQDIRVAYLGPQGTFSEQAVRQHFGHAVAAEPAATIDEVFRSAESGATPVRAWCRRRIPPTAWSAARSTCCSPRR